MNNFFKKIGAFLIALMLISAPAVQASQTFLYLFYDPENVGERNQVLGIATALKEYLPENTVRKEFELKESKELLSEVQENLAAKPGNKGMVVASGVNVIPSLRQLPQLPNAVIVHSSHQYYAKDHPELQGVADVVALPRSDVTPEILAAIQSPHTTLIQTAGVAHNMSPAVIEAACEAYEKDERNLPNLPPAPSYLGVILGGDADDGNKKMLYYTAEEARQLADYIAPQVRKEKTHLLILNGPRTGKHDQATGKLIATNHRDGLVDFVTAAFVDQLQKQQLIQGQDFTLLDFQYDQPSVYPVVVRALKANKSRIFVAGESHSMVSETADCGLDVTAYTHGAMSPKHKNQCVSEQAAGRVNILENQQGKWKLVEAAANAHARQPAARIIAEAIMKCLGEKAPK